MTVNVSGIVQVLRKKIKTKTNKKYIEKYNWIKRSWLLSKEETITTLLGLILNCEEGWKDFDLISCQNRHIPTIYWILLILILC
jgi:hypothetical protein